MNGNSLKTSDQGIKAKVRIISMLLDRVQVNKNCESSYCEVDLKEDEHYKQCK